MARTTQPSILWGTSFANTLTLSLFDNAVCYPMPGEGSEWVDLPGSSHDSWITGTDQILEGDARYIPTTNETSPFTATGWDGSTGWREFLEWAWAGNAFRWVYDKDTVGTYVLSYLIEPRMGFVPALEQDGTRRVRLKMRSSDGTDYTGY